MGQRTKQVVSLLIPVALGFLATSLTLGFMKTRFGIEIGDPPDLTGGEKPEEDTPVAE